MSKYFGIDSCSKCWKNLKELSSYCEKNSPNYENLNGYKPQFKISSMAEVRIFLSFVVKGYANR